MENPSFENDIVLFYLREGILHVQYRVAEIDLASAQEAIRLRHQVMGDRIMPCIADISAVKRVPKETRAFFSSAQAGEGLSAIAVVISNPVAHTMGNFFVKFHQPKYPFKLFINLNEATVWITKFI